jgi:biopolymer transport protein ExbD
MANRKKRSEDQGVEEPDLVPMMNLNFALIACLLSMTVNVPLGLISVQAPQLGGGGSSASKPEEEKKPKLNLTIFITRKGYNIAASGATLTGDNATPPRVGESLIPMTKNDKGEDDYDYAALNKKLIEIKKNFPLEDNVIITADPEVIYERVVGTMDASRESADGKELFPAVAFSAGIVG